MESSHRLSSLLPSLDRSMLALGVGDIGLLVGLLLFGQLEHGMNPLEQPVGALETLIPFVVGWVVVAALTGVYMRSVSTAVWQTARVTSVTWLAAANVGLLLRQSVFGDTAAWPFPLVLTGFGLVLLVGWRVGYALYVTTGRNTG